jgi:type IV pilus assembly protein PilA
MNQGPAGAEANQRPAWDTFTEEQGHMHKQMEKARGEGGFTLIELLVAIVVVGVLTAVAIVGIGGLTNNGKVGACKASVDAAKAASAVFYANNSGYPTSFSDMQNDNGKVDFDTANVTLSNGGKTMSGSGWSETIAGGGATSNTFTGSC